jgi:hypothetical protein
MTAVKRTRKTKAEQIAALEQKLAKLKSAPAANKNDKLGKDSPGIAELIAAFDNAVKLNGVKSSALIMELAKMKRARLVITPSKGKD